MLLLTRRVGETIRIGAEIFVTVIAIKGGQVRLGITAPDSVEVHREEIYQRIVQERADPAYGAGEGVPGNGPGNVPGNVPGVVEHEATGVKITVRKSRRKPTPPG